MSYDPLLSLNTEAITLGDKSVLILHLSGKITSDNIFDLNQQIKSVFEQKIYNCILDISSLDYVNSTGISMFLTIARTIDNNNGRLMLTSPSPFVKDLFSMTDLDTRFDIVGSLEDAKKKMASE